MNALRSLILDITGDEPPPGVRVDERRALAGEGETVRVRVPLGPRRYGRSPRVLASRS